MQSLPEIPSLDQAEQGKEKEQPMKITIGRMGESSIEKLKNAGFSAYAGSTFEIGTSAGHASSVTVDGKTPREVREALRTLGYETSLEQLKSIKDWTNSRYLEGMSLYHKNRLYDIVSKKTEDLEERSELMELVKNDPEWTEKDQVQLEEIVNNCHSSLSQKGVEKE